MVYTQKRRIARVCVNNTSVQDDCFDVRSKFWKMLPFVETFVAENSPIRRNRLCVFLIVFTYFSQSYFLISITYLETFLKQFCFFPLKVASDFSCARIMTPVRVDICLILITRIDAARVIFWKCTDKIYRSPPVTVRIFNTQDVARGSKWCSNSSFTQTDVIHT